MRRHWFKPDGGGHVAKHQFKNVVTHEVKRQAALHLCPRHKSPERRACKVLYAGRSTVQYQQLRADDGDLRRAIKHVSGYSCLCWQVGYCVQSACNSRKVPHRCHDRVGRPQSKQQETAAYLR